MRIKEFLTVREIEFDSVDVLADENGMKDLQALGARSVPVVSRGDQFVFAQSLNDVIEFLGLDEKAQEKLPPKELVRRLDTILEGAERFGLQMPPEALDERVVQNRPRSIGVLFHHIFQIPVAFLDAAAHDKQLVYDRLVEAPTDDLKNREAIAAYGTDVRRRIDAWWQHEKDPSAKRPLDTYFGEHPLHEVLERTTWHSGQHVRQMMDLLRQRGIEPNDPLGPEVFEGLPMPKQVWDD